MYFYTILQFTSEGSSVVMLYLRYLCSRALFHKAATLGQASATIEYLVYKVFVYNIHYRRTRAWPSARAQEKVFCIQIRSGGIILT